MNKLHKYAISKNFELEIFKELVSGEKIECSLKKWCGCTPFELLVTYPYCVNINNFNLERKAKIIKYACENIF